MDKIKNVISYWNLYVCKSELRFKTISHLYSFTKLINACQKKKMISLDLSLLKHGFSLEILFLYSSFKSLTYYFSKVMQDISCTPASPLAPEAYPVDLHG